MALTEQIRRAAIRAGLMGMNGTSVAAHKLEAFAAYLLDEENEACAELFESMSDEQWSCLTQAEGVEAIRARRKHEVA